MSFRLRWKRPLPEEFRRIGVELAEATLEHLRGGDVHQTRRAIKEMRALLAFAKGDPDAPGLALRFRDVARAISAQRDEEICRTALSRLEKEPESPPASIFDKARAFLKKRVIPAPDHAGLLSQLEAGRAELEAWHPRIGRKLLRRALKRSYRRCQRALEGATTEEGLHRLRRRLKQLWAQLRLVRKDRPKVVKKRIRKADEIAELLGLEHDLAVLQTRLGRSEAANALTPVIRLRRETLQKASLVKARRFLRKKPKAFFGKILRITA